MKVKIGRILKKADEEKKDEDFYDDKELSRRAEDDCISAYEEAFMRGWLKHC